MTAQTVEMMTLGQVPELTFEWRLRMAMKQAGMTQNDLADAIGMQQRTVDRWLNRGVTPKRGQIMACALATGVPVVWLDKGIDPSQVDSDLSDQLPRLDSNQEPSD
ncbi:helix-turn-helix domain-containing protein [Propionimicrobium lymphophilum]|uniref:helix-turn-helix domain-containing protein n=1 Tax=Propionimicrobium lymphophilum TaxID=33012 RepID=UPI0034DF10B5